MRRSTTWDKRSSGALSAADITNRYYRVRALGGRRLDMELEAPGAGWGSILNRAIERLAPALLRAAKRFSHADLGLQPAPAWLEPVSAYLDQIVAWNRRMDLTAARSPEELVDLTIADAAIVAAASEPGGAWIDVGSGAGAPGLILALMRPQLTMVLVEPRDRRVAFLRSVIGRLGLANVRVERKRSDALGPGQWDSAISRATLPPQQWLEEGARLCRRSVWVLLAREAIPSHVDFHLDLDIRYEWPLTSVPRRAVRFVHKAGTNAHH